MNELEYHGEKYCVLEDNTIQPIFTPKGKKKGLYKCCNEWYLSYVDNTNNKLTRKCSKVIEFFNK